MSLKRSLTAPPTSSLSSLTDFPAASPPIPKRSLPAPAHHNTYQPRANTRPATSKSSLSRVTSRVRIAQEDPFNCSGFFPEQATTPGAFTSSAADWDWVRSGNDDELDDQDEPEGDGDNRSAEPPLRRSRPTVFLLDDDEEGLGFSPDSEALSLPITPAAPSLLSPLANEFDDEFEKRIKDEDKMGVLRMTMSASRLFPRSHSLTSIPVLLSSDEEEATDLEGVHALISSRRLKLTTSSLTQSQSDTNLKSTLFSPVDDDNVEEWSGGERMLQMLGGYVVDNVRRVVGF